MKKCIIMMAYNVNVHKNKYLQTADQYNKDNVYVLNQHQINLKVEEKQILLDKFNKNKIKNLIMIKKILMEVHQDKLLNQKQEYKCHYMN